MLFAYLHPSFEATLQRIDKFATGARLFIRTLIVAGQTYFARQICIALRLNVLLKGPANDDQVCL